MCVTCRVNRSGSRRLVPISDMQFLPRLSCLAAACLLASISPLGRAVGQVPDSVQPQSGSLIGQVTDTASSPVSEADVVVNRESDSLVVAAGTTDSQGFVRLPRLPPGGPYAVLVRKIGYKPARTRGIYIGAGETIERSFILQS